MGKTALQITGLMFRREGEKLVIELESWGSWFEVAREPLEGNFSVILEASHMDDKRRRNMRGLV